MSARRLGLSVGIMAAVSAPFVAPRERLPVDCCEELEALTEATAAERVEWMLRERDYLERIGALEERLQEQRALRVSRESEWLEFTGLLSALKIPDAPEPPAFIERPGPERPDADAVRRERAMERGRRMLVELRALLRAEQVHGLDFLELGAVHDGWIGPVVVRLLDDWGRPSGTLAAERFHIECSRSGKTVTLVFEEGFESRGGVAAPFGAPAEPGGRKGGLRRIFLPGIEPEPWIYAMPELFDEESTERSPDDGLWDLLRVRTELNRLLTAESRGGFWRLRSFGGVVRGVLREVHLAQLDADGGVKSRLFADRLTITRGDRGVQLLLEDGVVEKNGQRAPFLEGRYRIYLPAASASAWKNARLPGLSEAPARSAEEP